MRVLIAAAAVLACATAAPSGLLAAPYAAYGGHLGYAAAPIAHAAPLAYAAPLAPALPTISSGDIAAASINAHVDASDHARASYDAARQLHDQASEIHGQQINAAESHSWQAVDAVKTAEAQLDGAAAGAAPQLAKSLVAPVAYAAPAAYAHAAPVAYAAPAAYAHAAPVAYAAPAAYAHAAPVAYAAPAAYAHAAPAAYAAAPVAYSAPGYSKSVSTQSLSQTHPSPIYSAPVYSHAAPLSYAAHAW